MRLWDSAAVEMEEDCRYTPIQCLRQEDVLWAMLYQLERHLHEIVIRPLVQSKQSLNIVLCLENLASGVSPSDSVVLSRVQQVSIEFTSTYSVSSIMKTVSSQLILSPIPKPQKASLTLPWPVYSEIMHRQ